MTTAVPLIRSIFAFRLPHLSFIAILSLSCAACGGGGGGGGSSSPPPPPPPGTGKSITLTWVAPTLNADGTTLSDIHHYNIYYGTSADDYTTLVEDVATSNCSASGGTTTCTYTITGLDEVTYYLTVTAVDSNGEESDFATQVSK